MSNTDTYKKLFSFRELQDGWNFGEGVKFDENIFVIAQQLINIANLENFKIDVFPGGDGEILVALYKRESNQLYYYEFIINKNFLITYLSEIEDEEVEYYDNINLDKAKTIIIEKGKLHNKCNLYEFSTSNITIKKKEDSQVWRLKTPEMEMTEEYPSLTSLVQLKNLFQYASTSVIFMQKLAANRQSFSFST